VVVPVCLSVVVSRSVSLIVVRSVVRRVETTVVGGIVKVYVISLVIVEAEAVDTDVTVAVLALCVVRKVGVRPGAVVVAVKEDAGNVVSYVVVYACVSKFKIGILAQSDREVECSIYQLT
jgi:hypothetical protein